MQTQRNVEGSLFLLSRQTEPHYRIFILNKKSQGSSLVNVSSSEVQSLRMPQKNSRKHSDAENHVEDVLPGLSTELTPPYLYFTNQKDEVTILCLNQLGLSPSHPLCRLLLCTDQRADVTHAFPCTHAGIGHMVL